MKITDDSGVDLTQTVPPDITDAIVHAMRLAPSGGNVQPWDIEIVANTEIVVRRALRTSLMDVALRGTYVALGALLLNAMAAAAYHGFHARVTEFPVGTSWRVVFRIQLLVPHRVDHTLAALYPKILARETNRHFGEIRTFDHTTVDQLEQAASAEDGRLHLITDRRRVADIADILAESDRIRYLSPGLHEQMMAELVNGPSGLGIEVGTLALEQHDLPKLEILRRVDVMACTAEMDRSHAATMGSALGDATRDRINASSGVMIVTVTGGSPRDYVRGGRVLERVWATACHEGLVVQPVSPVFLYAHSDGERRYQSAQYAAQLAALQVQFGETVGLRADETPILVMRVSHGVQPAVRSRRLSDQWVVRDNR